MDIRTKEEKKQLREPDARARPLQAVYSDKDVILKSLQGPFRTIAVSAASNILPAKKGIRYFIHSYMISARLIAAETTTSVMLYYTADGAERYIPLPTVPTVAAAVSMSGILDALTDENNPVVVAAGTASPTAMNVLLTYCEVPA